MAIVYLHVAGESRRNSAGLYMSFCISGTCTLLVERSLHLTLNTLLDYCGNYDVAGITRILVINRCYDIGKERWKKEWSGLYESHMCHL